MSMTTSGIGVVPAVALASVIAVAAGMACDDSPSRNPVQPAPTGTPAPFVTRLELSGPGTVNLGESVQFTAIGIMSDGSTRDLTGEATWRSSNTTVLTVSERGLATGVQAGDVSLSVSAPPSRSSVRADVIVVPAGTYRVTGAIRDQGVPVYGAMVEVTRGTATGLTTAGEGSYRLYGLAGDSEIRVRKDGYEVGVHRVTVTGHQTVDFDLILRRARDNAAGVYTLKVLASGACRASLPPEAWERTYQAMVSQDGPRLTVQLDGATFHTQQNRLLNTFGGVVQPGGVTFSVGMAGMYYGYFYYFPDVLEQLTPSSYYSFGGAIGAAITPAGITGVLEGELLVIGGPPNWRITGRCPAPDHSIVLTR
jgi:hypothetical protein